MLVTYRPLSRGRLSSRIKPPLRSTRRKAPALVIAMAAAFALTAASATADPSVASKQAEAQSVMGQIQQLDGSLERAVEAYNLANVKLARIRHDLADNTTALAVAKKSLTHAQTRLHCNTIRSGELLQGVTTRMWRLAMQLSDVSWQLLLTSGVTAVSLEAANGPQAGSCKGYAN